MADKDKRDETAKGSQAVKPATEKPGPRDEAAPGTPGTGENIDPKTGEKYIEGIGGA